MRGGRKRETSKGFGVGGASGPWVPGGWHERGVAGRDGHANRARRDRPSLAAGRSENRLLAGPASWLAMAGEVGHLLSQKWGSRRAASTSVDGRPQ